MTKDGIIFAIFACAMMGLFIFGAASGKFPPRLGPEKYRVAHPLNRREKVISFSVILIAALAILIVYKFL